MALAAGSSLLIGGYALLGLLRRKLYINIATAALLCALALAATAGGEFVREGIRKPYTVRGALYSNSIAPAEVEALRAVGAVANDPYPLANPERYPNQQLRHGAKVHRFLCSVCHTMNGANGLEHLAGTWSPTQMRMNIAKLQHTKPFMPPFAGTPEDLEALVQLIRWRVADQPAFWPVSSEPSHLAEIREWLDEAGTGAPGTARPRPVRGKEGR
jgi:mono/diheme cytochrome c family protein